ncbi:MULTISPECIES: DNA-processing protein DprA [Leucobacter]|uniref:DNA processing protein n=2 Tax=Leucobacter TaxID=55968 RepID=A0A4Q7U3J2_9MICO|nr:MULTISPECIES: DNA-processing protein DprA [Leucobacter]MBL3691078.1 DNA-protecting protein DprA [Leucobacter chromiireducens subsp. chromiireducens]MBL3700845.1 DNA-protecting protein DprA [Leucobacter luti]RZT68316.1 DNA processing protein [Leucobacter luti]
MRYTEDETARMLLAALVEPGHALTGQLVRLIGAAETVELIRDPGRPFPVQVDPLDGEHWREGPTARWTAGLSADLSAGFADQLRARTEQYGLRLLTPGRAGWPVSLQDLGDRAPVALWALGDPELLTSSVSSRVSVTGARAATAYGEEVTLSIVTDLAAEPLIIVSGGAYGIDAAAHRAAFGTRPESTIAVLASGLDRPYPSGHAELFRQITAAGSVLVSETAPEVMPTKWRFIARARLLAALGGATVIPEAGYRSGSLLTAARANELGRPVGVVPGPLTSAASSGCHRLIREGMAELVTSTGDVTEMLNPRPFRLGPAYEQAARRAAPGRVTGRPAL